MFVAFGSFRRLETCSQAPWFLELVGVTTCLRSQAPQNIGVVVGIPNVFWFSPILSSNFWVADLSYLWWFMARLVDQGKSTLLNVLAGRRSWMKCGFQDMIFLWEFNLISTAFMAKSHFLVSSPLSSTCPPQVSIRCWKVTQKLLQSIMGQLTLIWGHYVRSVLNWTISFFIS